MSLTEGKRVTMRAGKICFALLTAGLVVAACSSASARPSAYSYDGQDAATFAAAYPAATAAGLEGISAGEPAGPTSAPGETVPTAAAPVTSGNASSPESQIVKIGTISIQVASLDDSVASAADQIHVLGGWLAGSDRTSTMAEDRIPQEIMIRAIQVRAPNRFKRMLLGTSKIK